MDIIAKIICVDASYLVYNLVTLIHIKGDINLFQNTDPLKLINCKFIFHISFILFFSRFKKNNFSHGSIDLRYLKSYWDSY